MGGVVLSLYSLVWGSPVLEFATSKECYRLYGRSNGELKEDLGHYTVKIKNDQNLFLFLK